MTKDIAHIHTLDGADLLRRSDYFPTMVYSCTLHDAEAMNREILAAIYNERSRDGDGIERSNFKSLGGWHSQNNLHKEDAFKKLTDRVNTLANGIGDDLGYATDQELKITTMWSITNPPGSSNRAHVHPGALWSGVYYVHAPENSGKIEFIEPRTMHLMGQPVFKAKSKRKTECWTKVKVTPKAGKVLFFPSWLYHSVEPNLSEEEGSAADRVIISFNI
ncbi:MAG: TIGR02466 family protein, partial [Pseudomonadota bacterium]